MHHVPLAAQRHRHGPPAAAVAKRVADQIVDQLQDLAEVACDRRQPRFDLHTDLRAAFLREAPAAADAFADEGAEIKRVAWRTEPLRLDAREGYEVLDQPLHPPRLVVDDDGEALARLRVELAALLAQRLGIADEG